MKKNYIGGTDFLKAFEEYLSKEDTLDIALSLKISNAIVEQRKKLGMSQVDLADRLDVKQPVVSKWENGDTNYTIRTIVDIFSALGLDFELLIGNEAQNYRKGNSFENNLNKTFVRIDTNIIRLISRGA